MASQTSLTLATRVFTPTGYRDGIAGWRYVDDAVFKGTSTVTQSVRGPSKDGVYRVNYKVDSPRVKDADSACGCAGEEIDRAVARLDFVIPGAWTKAMRQEFLDRIQSLVADAVMTSSIDDLEGAW